MFHRPTTESLDSSQHSAVGAWFFGPKAENLDYLKEKVLELLDNYHTYRQTLYPDDRAYISRDMRESSLFKEQLDRLDKELYSIAEQLHGNSIPFWSPRYNAHMVTETTMPSVMGYLLGLFHNQNNVTSEASPMTTVIERRVGKQLCSMLGYSVPPDGCTQTVDTTVLCPRPVYGWGHLTCDGSIANLEAIWAARNLKFYPLSLRLAIEEGDLRILSDLEFSIELSGGLKKSFMKCGAWELLNLRPSTILNLPQQLYDNYGISQSSLGKATEAYSVQTVGIGYLLHEMEKRGVDKQPCIFVTATSHYSWPKGAAILGVGRDNLVGVAVDDHARMDIHDLDRKLDECLQAKRAVYAVVAIIGSTEHGTVDPLAGILALRKKYEQLGLSFGVHCDAALGGYFASTLRERAKDATRTGQLDYMPINSISLYTRAQLSHLGYADSITVDPHKSGYCPFPAGGLCYRDKRMRHLVTWTSPVVCHENDQEDSIGLYGAEGSKPGAAAVAVYLSHNVLGLDRFGYGSLLGEAVLTSTRLYCQWATMGPCPITVEVGDGQGRKRVKGTLLLEPFNALPAKGTGENREAQKQFIRERILSKDNRSMMEDNDAVKLLQQLGGDLMVNSFACNFVIDSEINEDISEANNLNSRIFNELSYPRPNNNKKISDVSLFLTSTILPQKSYGKCLSEFKSRLGLRGPEDLCVLVNVTMNPWAMAHDFIQGLADSLKSIALKEMQVSIARNVEFRDLHTFILQDCGSQALCGVYLPKFNMQNHRKQLIISCKIRDEAKYRRLVEMKSRSPQMYFSFANKEPMTLSELLNEETFAATVQEGLPWEERLFAEEVELTDITKVFERSLQPCEQPPDYPRNMIFLVYTVENGESPIYHMDHLFTRAPNIQLTSENISFAPEAVYDKVKGKQKWWFRLTRVNESVMQPLRPEPEDENEKRWFEVSHGLHFVPCKEFEFVALDYMDHNALLDEGQGKSRFQVQFSGKVRLGPSVFADYGMLNGEDTGPTKIYV